MTNTENIIEPIGGYDLLLLSSGSAQEEQVHLLDLTGYIKLIPYWRFPSKI